MNKDTNLKESNLELITNQKKGKTKIWSVKSDSSISIAASEMVESTCPKNLSKYLNENSESTDKVDGSLEQKSDIKQTEDESDAPIRRSNRIRKPVVKKDDMAPSRLNKKGNKGKKVPEASTSKSVDSEKKLNVGNKESPKNKSETKSPKSEKVSKKSVAAEKKKTGQKRKNDNSEEILSSCDSKTKNDDSVKNPTIKPQSLSVTCSKVLISSLEVNISDNQNPHKIKEEHSGTDKTVNSVKPVKVKSRWWRSSELEGVLKSDSFNAEQAPTPTESVVEPTIKTELPKIDPTVKVKEEKMAEISDGSERKPDDKSCTSDALPPYEHIEENIYRFNRRKCKSKKQVRRMVCDCTQTKEELEYGVKGCTEECLNRLLMIECGSRCPLGEACSNKQFQKKQYLHTQLFKTEKKGWGLKALQEISSGVFLMEFVGEVVNHKEYRLRVKQYAKEKRVHYYFMALKTDEILDATCKGNYSRFINHSCDPNCETQKWTVNGELRVGVFAKRNIHANEELTINYKFQRYGREAQKCYCEAANCSGYIGGDKTITLGAYSDNRSRKRKGAEDNKKREMEDIILEEEIEKLNGSRGLRNREDTLKLSRLMVRAEDPDTRNKLLDIILRTEEQACLRLFLDYHGLPLLWSWMTDIVELDLKAKILQVLSLLPITNKTMLLDGKIASIIEKWQSQCFEGSKDVSDKSLSASEDSPNKKLCAPDLSDSETDSGSAHNVVENTSSLECGSKKDDASSESDLTASAKDSSSDDKERTSKEDGTLRASIVGLASELINNWKNLKEVFRIPRVEQQKRKEDEMEVDKKSYKAVVAQDRSTTRKEITPSRFDVHKSSSHIQVYISGTHHSRACDYEHSDMKIDESRRFNQSRPSILVKPRQVCKPVRPPFVGVNITEKDLATHKLLDDLAKCSPDTMSPSSPIIMPATMPLPNYTDQPIQHFPSPNNIPIVTPQSEGMSPTSHLYPPPQLPPTENASPQSPLIYPPQIRYPSQMPFMNPVSHLPPNSNAMPPPSSVPNHIPIVQQAPISTVVPHVQPGGPPPSSSNYLLGPPVPGQPPVLMNQPPPVLPNQPPPVLPNQPPPSVLQNQPPPSVLQNQPPPFLPRQLPSSVPNLSAPTGMFGDQNQPMYFMAPQQAGVPNNPMPECVQIPSSCTGQPVPTTFPVPVVQEEPKSVKLPKNWRTATDSEGNIYYYHSVTRKTQWDPPPEEEEDEEDSEEDSSSSSQESESSNTPTYDEPKVISKHSKKKSRKRKTTKAAADTSVVPVRPEVAKKIKELFRTKISSFIIHCLNVYRKPSCTTGRITSNEDFKYLARKLTHYTMTKELKQCKNVEDLDCNDTVMHKAKDFIKKYMSKYGSQYSRKDRGSPPE